MGLFRAIEHDHPEVVSYLFSQGAELSNEAIKWALRSRAIAVFKILIAQGLDLDNPDYALWSELDSPPIT